MKELNDTFKQLVETLLNPGEMELAAIWLEKSVITGEDERKYRIAEGMTITVKDGIIVDTIKKATHKVLGCVGTINSSRLSLTLLNLETFTPETLQIR